MTQESSPSADTNPIQSLAVICRCRSYEPEQVDHSLERLFEHLGGIGRFIRPCDRVLIKPNLIVPAGPDRPAQTHPAVIIAMAKLIKEAGAKPVVGDSPAWGTAASCLKALEIDTALQAMGVSVVQLNQPVRTAVNGVRVGISRIALEVDKIINLPKFKAHQQLGATFAIKNMFGCVAGKEKALWHFLKGANAEDFCRMLVEIYRRLCPVLTIIDGVIAMEGQGPINGTAKPLGFLIGGADPIACEYACCRLVGMDPLDLPILKAARAMGYGCSGDEALTLVGDSYQDLICRDFQFARQTPLRFTFGRICKSIAKQAVLLSKSAFSRI
jgi:uncharacterized protein (DUF362 family)